MNTELHVDLVFNMKISQSDAALLHKLIHNTMMKPIMQETFKTGEMDRLDNMSTQSEQLVNYTGE